MRPTQRHESASLRELRLSRRRQVGEGVLADRQRRVKPSWRVASDVALLNFQEPLSRNRWKLKQERLGSIDQRYRSFQEPCNFNRIEANATSVLFIKQDAQNNIPIEEKV